MAIYITIFAKQDSLLTKISFEIAELNKLAANLDTFFDIKESWFSLFEERRQFSEDQLLEEFGTYEKSSFDYLTSSIYKGRLLPLTPTENTQDICNLCMKLGLHTLIKNIMVETDEFFNFCLTNNDRHLVEEEKKLRVLLFGNEMTDFRSDDYKYYLHTIIKNVKLKDPEARQVPNIPYPKITSYQNDFELNMSFDSKTIIETIFTVLMGCPLEFDGTFIIAGGSINTCITSKESFPIINDIDIFFITKNQEQAETTLYNSISRIIQRSKSKLIVRTQNSITVEYKLEKEGIKIQFILRLYNSIAQVISGFDIDASCVAFDGEKLYAMPRYVRAINTGYILVDPERQSSTYAYRLAKYRNRGFDIAFPGYNPTRVVNPGKGIDGVIKSIYKKEHGKTWGYGGEFADDYDGGLVLNHGPQITSTTYGRMAINHIKKTYKFSHIKGKKKDSLIVREIMQNKHKYAVPMIVTKSITKIFTGRYSPEEAEVVKYESAKKFDFLKKEFISKLDILKERCQISEHDYTTLLTHVHNLSKNDYGEAFINNDLQFTSTLGCLSFRLRNPGSQLTNSFQPVTGNWFSDAYVYTDGVIDLNPDFYKSGQIKPHKPLRRSNTFVQPPFPFNITMINPVPIISMVYVPKSESQSESEVKVHIYEEEVKLPEGLNFPPKNTLLFPDNYHKPPDIIKYFVQLDESQSDNFSKITIPVPPLISVVPSINHIDIPGYTLPAMVSQAYQFLLPHGLPH